MRARCKVTLCEFIDSITSSEKKYCTITFRHKDFYNIIHLSLILSKTIGLHLVTMFWATTIGYFLSISNELISMIWLETASSNLLVRSICNKLKTWKTEARNTETLTEYMNRYNENKYLYYLLVVKTSSFLSTVLEFDVEPLEMWTLYCIQNCLLSMSVLEVMPRLNFTTV